MPGFKIHKRIGGIVALLIGIILMFFFYKYIPIDWRILLIPLIVIVYSQLPDLDIFVSRIRKRTLQFVFFFMAISSIVFAFINIWILLLLLTFTGVFGLLMLRTWHRGFFHSYWFVFLISLPMYPIHWALFVIAFACASSHIMVDRVFSKVKRIIKKKFGFSEPTNITIKI